MSPKKPKRVALYLRVSTGEQTTRNQRRELPWMGPSIARRMKPSAEAASNNLS
jgi:hypothetical protein